VTTKEANVGGLNGQVILTIFGDAGEPMIAPLGCPGVGLFQTGATDVFHVSFAKMMYNFIYIFKMQNYVFYQKPIVRVCVSVPFSIIYSVICVFLYLFVYLLI